MVLTPAVSSLAIVVMIVSFSALGGTTTAQQATPETADASFPNATPLPPNADGQLAGDLSRAPLVPETGPDGPNQPDLSFSYYKVIGTAFQPRESTSTYAYTTNGCMYQNGGPTFRFQAPLILPEGSEIKYVRIYYLDTVATDMTVWLSRYEPGQTNLDLVSVVSTGSGGYGTILSPLITHTVDMATYAYVLTWGTSTATSGNEICGVRVAYYPPPPDFSASSKAVNTTSVTGGDLMTYTLAVANNGGTAATFVLTDTFNPHLTLVSAPGLSGTTTLTATGMISRLEQQSFNFTARVSATYSGTVTNTAQLSGDGTTRDLHAPTVSVAAITYELRLPVIVR
jgi:uncharacterized repeat protein (TIGR01451 family)